MEAFLISTVAVAIAEIGDKTQLLALLLICRYRRPGPIVAGILIATLANHGVAALAGGYLAGLVDPVWLRWLLGGSFIAMGLWMLVPDRLDESAPPIDGRGVFLATLAAFFLAEIGDKTQVATVALAARFDDLAAVVLGTTAGMMLANVPVVLFGEQAAKRLPLRLVRAAAAALFVGLGAILLVAGS